MTNTKNLLPISTANGNLIDTTTGETQTITYLQGRPRQYRFDASNGKFNIKGEIPLTKKGKAFTILPVAFRIFKDDILGMGLKKWVEFYFINEKMQLCALLLHGYSVENLLRMTDEMFYDGVNLCQVALTIEPIEKTSSQVIDGKNPKYFMCEFSYQPLDQAAQDNLEAVTKHLRIWREETFTMQADVQLCMNWDPETSHLLMDEEATEETDETTEVPQVA